MRQAPADDVTAYLRAVMRSLVEVRQTLGELAVELTTVVASIQTLLEIIEQSDNGTR
jgi:hypothetical protein